MWVVVVTVIIALVTLLYYKFTRKYGMFSAKGIMEPPKYFPFGTVYNWKLMTGRASFNKSLDELYKEYGHDHKVLGTFANSSPVLVVNDLNLARDILIRDFDHFCDRRSFDQDESSEVNRYAANMLLTLKGEKWKKVRNLMSPAFTSGKLKAMVPFIQRVGNDLVTHLEGLADAGEEFAVKEVMVSYAVDCIATCGFGFEANSFKEPDGQFRKMVLKATGGDGGNKKQMLKILTIMLLPDLGKMLNFSILDEEPVMFFADVVKKALVLRKEENIGRGDLIDLMLEALNASSKDDDNEGIPADEVETILIANLIALFFVGFDTTATALTMTLGYLSKLPDVQERLYQEINDAMEEKETDLLDYETIQSLEYLDKVFMETLRHYFVANVERECSKDYKLPGTDFMVPKGMLVQIPASALQRDPKYYPDPDNFNPDDNFSDKAKADRPTIAFLGFGQGPRNCIGMRLALRMAKMCLVKVIAKFKVSPGPKQPEEFIMSTTDLTGMPEGGVWCKIEKRSE